MRRTTAALAALLLWTVAPAHADYSVSDRGDWPKGWPRELEPLRKQSHTLVGPMAENRHFAISFTSRQQFESAWPHILKVKSKRSPIFLVRAPNFYLGEHNRAGVVIHCPPARQPRDPATPEVPIAGASNLRVRWMNTTYVELVVDGDIVGVTRIGLPKGSPIIDERDPSPQTGAEGPAIRPNGRPSHGRN